GAVHQSAAVNELLAGESREDQPAQLHRAAENLFPDLAQDALEEVVAGALPQGDELALLAEVVEEVTEDVGEGARLEEFCFQRGEQAEVHARTPGCRHRERGNATRPRNGSRSAAESQDLRKEGGGEPRQRDGLPGRE